MKNFKFKKGDVVFCINSKNRVELKIKKAFHNVETSIDKDCDYDWNSYEMENGIEYREDSLVLCSNSVDL